VGKGKQHDLGVGSAKGPLPEGTSTKEIKDNITFEVRGVLLQGGSARGVFWGGVERWAGWGMGGSSVTWVWGQPRGLCLRVHPPDPAQHRAMLCRAVLCAEPQPGCCD
jgi:hypothetical protein